MKKQTLTLDYSTSKALQIFLLYNGIINKYKNGDVLYDDDKEMINYYLFGTTDISLKQQKILLNHHFNDYYDILSLLTLYDNIKIQNIETHYFSFNHYDTSNLDEFGIKLAKPLKECPPLNIIEEAKVCFNTYKKKIIFEFMQDNESMYFEAFPNDWIIDYYVDNNLFLQQYSNSEKYLPSNILRDYYDRYQNALFSYLDAFFRGLIDNILLSKTTYYSKIFKESKHRFVNIEDYKEVEANAMLLNFSSCISLFPRPKSFDDVYKIRYNPQMVSFRNVYAEWVNVLQNGNIELAIKMKKDIIKANKALQKIDSICKLDKNFFYVVIKTLVTFDPTIAIAMAATDFIKSYILDYQKQKNSWVLLPGFQEQYNNWLDK